MYYTTPITLKILFGNIHSLIPSRFNQAGMWHMHMTLFFEGEEQIKVSDV